ncbi:hypothetical protein [Streptomyces sp. NPDC101181]|uniref:hypothetical protein n=1 Tax=Streptomyces sp. NPDC101181 TaxID=3366125 RepID=UPI00380F776C
MAERRRQREVRQVVTLTAPNAQDCVALAEIELCGELMIAASAAGEERLSPDRIDEVLNVRDGEAESWTATVPRQASARQPATWQAPVRQASRRQTAHRG